MNLGKFCHRFHTLFPVDFTHCGGEVPALCTKFDMAAMMQQHQSSEEELARGDVGKVCPNWYDWASALAYKQLTKCRQNQDFERCVNDMRLAGKLLLFG